MLKIIRSLYTFYLNHFFVGFCITLSAAWLFSVLGIHAITILFWYKAITMVIFYYSISQIKKHQFLYYQNLGISKKLLWCVTLGVDFLLFIVLMVLIYNLQWHITL